VRILVVDDNVSLAENLAEVLELGGHSTAIADSGATALAEAASQRPDVVVTDYRLPDMSGAQLVRRLREAGVDAQAIVISAHTDEHTIAEARLTGATFVAKPVAPDALGRLIVGPR
jgi:CheY-like chemotaxis protein